MFIYLCLLELKLLTNNMFIKLVYMFTKNYICTIKLNRKQENNKEYGRS